MINNPGNKFNRGFVILCLILIELVYLIVMVILSDEEEAEEASEEKDRDIVNSADSSRNPTPKSSAKFGAKTIDLGAAANFGKSEITSSIDSPSNVKTSSAPTLQVGNADLVDLFDLTPPGMQPLQTSATVPAQKDFFADFASAPPGGGSINGKAKVVNICAFSLRSCPLPIIPLCLSREEGMIHFFVGSHVKKPESGLFSDWIGNNTDDLRCSDWPKCRHPLVVVDFSLHFCLRNEQ